MIFFFSFFSLLGRAKSAWCLNNQTAVERMEIRRKRLEKHRWQLGCTVEINKSQQRMDVAVRGCPSRIRSTWLGAGLRFLFVLDRAFWTLGAGKAAFKLYGMVFPGLCNKDLETETCRVVRGCQGVAKGHVCC